MTEAFGRTWEALAVGGFYMLVIFLCSLVALTVIVFKMLTLRRARIVPTGLAEQVEKISGTGQDSARMRGLESEACRGETPLARLCGVAMSRSGAAQAEVKEAVQSTAREEIVKMHTGLPILEVVITIAPLLGLLGTASGLVLVFRELGPAADHVEIARGISRALYTTIAGLAVAVPAVVAHSYFSRKIETMAARLEVMMNRVVSVYHAEGRPPEGTPAETPAEPYAAGAYAGEAMPNE
ncbi:MAG: MotA/TolQ/ExbB proton channel family protein [Akkermansiaceae bacterium]|nr:MotA/TolQ/ExbB proton channel family protein [Akkermansiaceae bacterium]NNM28538.1 MotA/TolQ/ExbB proton channel family protein [Akkermansiaceae bacterium]